MIPISRTDRSPIQVRIAAYGRNVREAARRMICRCGTSGSSPPPVTVDTLLRSPRAHGDVHTETGRRYGSIRRSGWRIRSWPRALRLLNSLTAPALPALERTRQRSCAAVRAVLFRQSPAPQSPLSGVRRLGSAGRTADYLTKDSSPAVPGRGGVSAGSAVEASRTTGDGPGHRMPHPRPGTAGPLLRPSGGQEIVPSGRDSPAPGASGSVRSSV